MPPRTRDTAEPEADASTEAQGHVVLTDMLTFTAKGRRPGSTVGLRAPRGARVVIDPELNDIGYLEELKAIGPDDGSSYRRTTAKVLAEAAGGREDPVRAPDNLFDITESDVTAGEVPETEDEAPDNSTPADDE